MNISLRAGDKIYINGGVIRVDRKVTIEILNKITFLLESHVIQASETTTPLRQIYFVLQTMLMDPTCAPTASVLARKLISDALRAIEHPELLSALKKIDLLVIQRQYFEAMKSVRTLYPIEQEIMFPLVASTSTTPHAA